MDEGRPSAAATPDGRRARLSDVRIPELDGLRGVAVLAVIVWHYLGVQHIAGHAHRLAAMGASLTILRSGVDLFFVLSGFLITGILLDHRDSPGLFRVFYTRRFLRIFPVYYLLLLPFALAPLLGVHVPALMDGDAPLPFGAYATFTQNYFMAARRGYGAPFGDVTWSLAIEEQFYLVLPAVLRFLPPRLVPRVFVAGALAAIGLRVAAMLGLPNGYMVAYVATPCRLDALLVGGLIAWALRQPALAERLRRARARIAGALVALVPLVLVLARAVARDMELPMGLWGHTLLTVFYGLTLLTAVLWSGERLVAPLRASVLARLGMISYAAYLLHSNVLRVVFTLARRPNVIGAPTDLALTALAFVATIGACLLSWRLLERPLIARGRRVRYPEASLEAAARRRLAFPPPGVEATRPPSQPWT